MKASERNEYRRAVARDILPLALERTAEMAEANTPSERIAVLAAQAAVRAANALLAELEAVEGGQAVEQRKQFLTKDGEADELARAYQAERRESWAPCPMPLPNELRARLRGALAKSSLAEWKERLFRAASSDLLAGRGSRPMLARVNIAWLTQPSIVSLLDAGHFDNGAAPLDARQHRMAQAATAAADLMNRPPDLEALR